VNYVLKRYLSFFGPPQKATKNRNLSDLLLVIATLLQVCPVTADQLIKNVVKMNPKFLLTEDEEILLAAVDDRNPETPKDTEIELQYTPVESPFGKLLDVRKYAKTN
jgi:hypothetical protein